MKLKGEERRKHIRIFLPGGQVRLISGPFLALIGKVMDLSLGGIKFISESRDFNKGDKLDIEVTLPNGIRFKCQAGINFIENIDNQIIYSVQFENLGFREQIELGEFIVQIRAEHDEFIKKNLH